MVWKPNVTVAAVVERDGRFLMVEESGEGGRVFNQPAGHWEPGETLVEACVRETLEESACRFVPEALVGIYRWHAPNADTTFLRFTFCGRIEAEDAGRALDPDILGTVWLTPEELRALAPRHRSPLVMLCAEDYLAGKRYALDLLTHI